MFNHDNIKLQNVKGDGNCLIHALLVNNGFKQHFEGYSIDDIRNAIVDKMQELYDIDELSSIDIDSWAAETGTTVEEYLLSLRQDGTHLGVDAIDAASHIIKCPINLYNADNKCETYGTEYSGKAAPVRIYHDQLHFQAVVECTSARSNSDNQSCVNDAELAAVYQESELDNMFQKLGLSGKASRHNATQMIKDRELAFALSK